MSGPHVDEPENLRAINLGTPVNVAEVAFWERAYLQSIDCGVTAAEAHTSATAAVLHRRQAFSPPPPPEPPAIERCICGHVRQRHAFGTGGAPYCTTKGCHCNVFQSSPAPPKRDEEICDCGHRRASHNDFGEGPRSCSWTLCKCDIYVPHQ